MIKKLINPFYYFAGFKSLTLGLVIIIATATVGYFSKTHFPDIISIKTGPDFSIWYFIVQGLMNWIVVSTLLYIAAIILSKSSVRLIDIFGTQALSRFPYFIASFMGFSNALDVFNKYLLWTFLQLGEPVVISGIQMTIGILIVVFSLLLAIWMITLMFNAFKVSANLKGNMLVITFIVVIILSLIASGYLNQNITLKLQ